MLKANVSRKKYAPNKMELASRDVVAKAIEDEIAAGRFWFRS